MALYLDTSALVKLYILEDGRDTVLAAMRDEPLVAISNVGYAEARAALARMRAEQRLRDDEHRRAVSDLDSDWSTLVQIDVVAPIPHMAGDLAEQYGLRGFDAIHLASAVYSQEYLGTVRFLAFDRRLIDAAAAAGLAVVPS